jgi:hypothetical protein
LRSILYKGQNYNLVALKWLHGHVYHRARRMSLPIHGVKEFGYVDRDGLKGPERKDLSFQSCCPHKAAPGRQNKRGTVDWFR